MRVFETTRRLIRSLKRTKNKMDDKQYVTGEYPNIDDEEDDLHGKYQRHPHRRENNL